MKVKIMRSALLEGLKAVQNIVGGKGSSPIIQNVLLEAEGDTLTMVTTDLDISIRMVSECKTESPGKSTLPVKLLFNSIVKASEGEVEIQIDDNERATIKAGSAKFKIAGRPASEFPKLPEQKDAYSYTIPQAVLREMIRKVFYAASQDDTRRTLKGVLMSLRDQKITMVATDGRRLAMVENELEFSETEERDIVIPPKTVQEIQRALVGEEDISISIQNTQMCLKIGGMVIYSKLIDEKYPNYRQVIPRETSIQVSVDRQLLLDALERVSVMTMDEAHSTKLSFSSGKLTVSSAANDIGEAKDEVPIKYEGESLDITFNPSYVMDSLKAIDDDEVTVNLNNGHSPAVIKCSIPYLYVLMPLRIN